MGDHHRNGNVIARANGVQLPPKGEAKNWQLLPLGDDYVIADVVIEKALDAEGNICMVLAMLAGTFTPIGGLRLGKFMLHEMGKIPVEKVKAMVDGAFTPKVVTETTNSEKPPEEVPQ